MNQEKIGKFIKEKRKEKKLTQEELASILRVSNRTISKWENGVCLPDYAMINDLCKALDITINEFLSGENIDEKSYRNKLEENMLKSINYKVKKNNWKIIITSFIVLMLSILLLLFINHAIIFYLVEESINNIKIRKIDVESKKIINDKIIPNDLANQNINNALKIYIPDGWEIENDISKSFLVERECSVFFKNYSGLIEESDGYIKICDDDNIADDVDNLYDDNKLFTAYDRYMKYLNMKDINLFSSKNDIRLYNRLVMDYGSTCYDDDDNLTSCYNDGDETHILVGDYSTEAIYDYYSYDDTKIVDLSAKYNIINYSHSIGETYRLIIYSKNNSLSNEEILKIIYSIKPIR